MFKRDITTFPSKFKTNKMDTFWRNLACKSGSTRNNKNKRRNNKPDDFTKHNKI